MCFLAGLSVRVGLQGRSLRGREAQQNKQLRVITCRSYGIKEQTCEACMHNLYGGAAHGHSVCM